MYKSLLNKVPQVPRVPDYPSAQVVTNAVINGATCVNILQKLILLLALSQGKPLFDKSKNNT